MTSQFFREITLFPCTDVPDECRTAVIMKGSMFYDKADQHNTSDSSDDPQTHEHMEIITIETDGN